MAASNNKLITYFSGARLVSKCFLSPWSYRWASHSVSTTITTTVRVINSIHYYTTYRDWETDRKSVV